MKLLFYHYPEQGYELHGTRNWQHQTSNNVNPEIIGDFLELNSANVQSSVNLCVDSEKIYMENNGQFKYQQLNLTVMEDNFYLNNSRKVYQLRLMRQNCITLLYTYNLKLFVKFYCFLAKHCILTDFTKRFKVMQQIGVGGSCHVYTGINIYSSEIVALKVLDKKFLLEDSDRVSLITNEITILERLKKYHLSPLIQIFQTLDCIVLVLQKAQAGNMIDYICRNANNYDSQMIKITLSKVLTNLKELHCAGFIHRDIKPENVFFETNSVRTSLFLGDFGLSIQKKSENVNQISKKCSGTRGFLAPQVLHNNKYDQKCDLFSCGCLFYFMMTGRCLFSDSNSTNMYNMITNSQYIRQQTNKLKQFGRQAISLLQLMLEINPQKRISAEEALRQPYFDKTQNYNGHTDPNDSTLQQFIITKINKYWANS